MNHCLHKSDSLSNPFESSADVIFCTSPSPGHLPFFLMILQTDLLVLTRAQQHKKDNQAHSYPDSGSCSGRYPIFLSYLCNSSSVFEIVDVNFSFCRRQICCDHFHCCLTFPAPVWSEKPTISPVFFKRNIIYSSLLPVIFWLFSYWHLFFIVF